MKKLSLALLLSTVIFASSFETDPVIDFEDSESLVINGQPVTDIDGYICGPLSIKVCPGAGEKCSVTYEYKGFKYKLSEEKAIDGDHFEVTWIGW